MVPENIHTHPKEIGHWKLCGGGGSQKLKFVTESMKQTWKFQGDRTVQTKKPSLEEIWIFSGTTFYSFAMEAFVDFVSQWPHYL